MIGNVVNHNTEPELALKSLVFKESLSLQSDWIQMLSTLFKEYSFLTKVTVNSSVEGLTTKCSKLNGKTTFSKKDYLPVVEIRKAKIEDCDDVLQLLNQHYNDTRFNEYDMSQILEPLNVDSFSFVAFSDSKAVAFIHYSREIEHDLVQEQFQVGPFDNFTALDSQRKSVVAIKYYYINPEFDYEGINLIKKSFQSISKEADYCLLSLPSDSTSELARYFRYVKPVDYGQSSESLYVLNRFDLEFKCQWQKFDATRHLSQIQESYTTDSMLVDNAQVFVFTCADDSVVGFIVLQKIVNSQLYIDQFDIEQFFYSPLEEGECYLVVDLQINPLFELQTRFLLRSIMQDLKVSGLIYNGSTLNPVVYQIFVPVKNRRRIQFKDNLRDGIQLEPDFQSNILFTNPSTILEYRNAVPRKIVIMGLTDITLGLVEFLVYNSNRYYFEIILISEREISSFSTSLFTVLELEQLGLFKFIKNYRRKCIGIDRSLKQVVLGSERIKYDDLIVSPELEFSKGTANATTEYEFSVDQVLPQAAKAVFYGWNLKTINAAHFFRLANPESHVYIIKSRNETDFVLFDKDIESRILEQLDACSIKLVNTDKFNVTQNLVETDDQFIETDLVVYGKKQQIPSVTLEALKSASIIFDGSIVVDRNLKTNDSNIFCAGPCLKFRASEKISEDMSRFNQREVGHKLAAILLNSMGIQEFKRDFSFRLARIESGLVLNLNLLIFVTPEKQLGGNQISTDSNGRFVKIHFNKHGYIDSFCYIGKDSIKNTNILSLYGQNEKVLNRMVTRFNDQKHKINDLIEFLDDPTIIPVYHDRFSKFSAAVLERVRSSSDQDVKQVLETLESLEIKGKLNSSTQQELLKAFEWIDSKQELDEIVKQFLLETKIFAHYP